MCVPDRLIYKRLTECATAAHSVGEPFHRDSDSNSVVGQFLELTHYSEFQLLDTPDAME
jgi:hypothetical protein